MGLYNIVKNILENICKKNIHFPILWNIPAILVLVTISQINKTLKNKTFNVYNFDCQKLQNISSLR